MQFVAPIKFEDAIQKLGARSPVGAQLSSQQWSAVPLALRERAIWSATIESVRFAQDLKTGLTDFLTANRDADTGALKVGSRAKFIENMRRQAIAEGLGPIDTEDAGTIKDIRSEERLGLIFDIQTKSARAFGDRKQGMDPDVLDEFPAQRFIRVMEVHTERAAHIPFEGQIALKTDLDFWLRINQDFGVPWGPWGWGCGHDVEDVDRDTSDSLGLTQPGQNLGDGEAPDEPFNAHLQASVKNLDPDLQKFLAEKFGDRIVIDGDSARWLGQPDLESAAEPISPSEKIALLDYTDVGYSSLNRNLLRSGEAAPLEYLRQADLLSSALQKIPPVAGLVYRGADLSAAALARYLPGNAIQENFFISTSTQRGRAFDGNTLFEIRSKTARPIASFSDNPHEAEALFDRNTQFQVVSRELRGDQTFIVLQEI